jgi:tRNA threonylcarbamoyladenosine biosynthesis protein TsaE
MKELRITLPTEEDMLTFAGKLSHTVKPGTVIYLLGQLGAGKTTFTRGFLRGLGYEQKVKSPTYTLVEPYTIGNLNIFHFDLYRVKTPKELEYIGIHDYFSPDAICLIEWPEQGFSLLPRADITCHIKFADKSAREIHLQAHTSVGEACLNKVSR